MGTAVKKASGLATMAALVLAAALAGLALTANSAQAFEQHEAGGVKSGTYYVMLSPTDTGNDYWSVYDPNNQGKMTKATSNKKSVVTVAYPSKNGFDAVFKKPGTATVKYKYKGKQYTYKFVVKKYVNPVKSMKIGSNEYKAKFKKADFLVLKKSQAGKKVTLKPISGWKVKEVILTDAKWKTKTIKKSSFKLAKNQIQMVVVWQNKKTGATESSAVLFD